MINQPKVNNGMLKGVEVMLSWFTQKFYLSCSLWFISTVEHERSPTAALYLNHTPHAPTLLVLILLQSVQLTAPQLVLSSGP